MSGINEIPDGKIKCPACGGTGENMKAEDLWPPTNMPFEGHPPCPTCKGARYVDASETP